MQLSVSDNGGEYRGTVCIRKCSHTRRFYTAELCILIYPGNPQCKAKIVSSSAAAAQLSQSLSECLTCAYAMLANELNSASICTQSTVTFTRQTNMRKERDKQDSYS